MVLRDTSNPTYSHSVDELFYRGYNEFQHRKYSPKIALIQSYFPRDWQEKRILDVGIGYGYFLRMLEKDFYFMNLYGMDPFPESIKISQQYTSANIKEGNIEDSFWPFSRQFDVITCFDVVEHLKIPDIFFRNAKKHMKDNGIVIVSTPNKQLPYYLRAIPIIGLTDNNPTHINVKPPGYWVRLAKKEGFDILETWKGEDLSHIKLFPKVVSKLCEFVGTDHRQIPVLNAFEQSFVMVLAL